MGEGRIPPGRAKKVSHGYGPVAQFAAELRTLHEAAGRPTYRTMAKRANYSYNALSEADRGFKPPTWECLRAYLRACGVTEADEEWQERLSAARVAGAVTAPPEPTGRMTTRQLATALRELMATREVTAAGVAERCTAVPFEQPDAGQVPWQPPAAEQVHQAVMDAVEPPDRNVVIGVIWACGGTPQDALRWDQVRERLAEADAEAEADSYTPVRREAPPVDVPVIEPRRWWVPAYAALTLAAALLIVIVIAILPSGPDRHALGGKPGPVPLTEVTSEAPVPAPTRIALRTLAAKVANLPVGPVSGDVTFIRVLRTLWDPDSTRDEPYWTVEDKLWWRPDGSGRHLRRLDRNSPPPTHPTGPLPEDEYFPAGKYPLVIGTPGTDEFVLGAQLHELSGDDKGATAILRSVAKLYDSYFLTPQQRATILRVLADTSGLLEAVQNAPCRNNREGLKISANTPDGTGLDFLIFGGDGQLLCHSTILRKGARPEIGSDLTTAMVVYLDHQKVADLSE